jgi:hypothetical protein
MEEKFKKVKILLGIDTAKLDKLIIHKVGNKGSNESILLNDKYLNFTDDNEDTRDFFLSKLYFNNDFEKKNFVFQNQKGLDFNIVYDNISKMFENEDCFITGSEYIAQHLYDIKILPSIRAGYLLIAKFKSCNYNGQEIDAIGIFEVIEKRHLQATQEGNKINFSMNYTMNLDDIKSGCLIYNKEKEKGYTVKCFSKAFREFWFDDFLDITEKVDNSYFTEKLIYCCKSFVICTFPKKYVTNQIEQAKILNKMIEYFKDRGIFNAEDFASRVFEGDEILVTWFISQMKDYTRCCGFEDIPKEFYLDEKTIKKHIKALIPIIKLDKDIELKIKTNKHKIEYGKDDKKDMNYYKIYF